MNCLIDLDGTLLDASDRLYGLFCEMIGDDTSLSRRQYWDLKRAKQSHAVILKERFGYSDEEIRDFERRWLDRIEDADWLERDTPFDGVGAHLETLAQNADLHLLTARQRPEMVRRQLEKMGWSSLFKSLLITGGKRSKDELLEGAALEPADWLIGDTGYDVKVGKKLGVRTAAVSNGFLSRESLAPYDPDVLLDKFTDFVPWAIYDRR